MRIPVQTDPSILPSVQLGVRVAAPDISNPAATQLQQVGQALSEAGQSAAKIHIDKLEEVNRNLHDEAAQGMSDYGQNLKAEYQQRRGRDALAVDGKPLDAYVDEQFGKYVDDAAAKLPNEAVRQQFKITATGLRGELRRGATEWMSRQSDDWNDSVQVGNIRVGSGMMLDPDPAKQEQGLSLIRNSVPLLKANQGKDPAYVQSKVAEALTPVYARKIDALLDAGAVDAARDTFAKASQSGDLTEERRALLADRLAVSARHFEAIGAVDSATSTAGWTMGDAEKALREKFKSDPKTLEVARGELRYRDAIRDDALREMETKIAAPAEQELADALRAGKPVSMSSRSLTALSGIGGNKLYREMSARFALHNEQLQAHSLARQERIRSLQAHSSAETSASLLFDMSANPDAYKGRNIAPDLQQMVRTGKMNPSDALRVQQQWDKIQKGESTPEMATFGTAEQYMNDLLGSSYISAGVGSKPKAFSELGKPEQADMKARMRVAIDSALQKAQVATGGKFDQQAVKDVVKSAFRDAWVKEGFFRPETKPMLVADPEGTGQRAAQLPSVMIPHQYDAIPATSRATIEAALRANGLPVTKASVVEYFNALSNGNPFK